jgi:hypothetical protein
VHLCWVRVVDCKRDDKREIFIREGAVTEISAEKATKASQAMCQYCCLEGFRNPSSLKDEVARV